MIERFAETHRLKVTRDACNDPIIAGRIYESNIYEHGDGLAVIFVTDGRKAPRTGLYNRFRGACLAAGMVQIQSGDGEGAFTFDPDDAAQTKVALKGIRARVKRRMSPEQAAAGAARLAAARTVPKFGWKAIAGSDFLTVGRVRSPWLGSDAQNGPVRLEGPRNPAIGAGCGGSLACVGPVWV